MMDYLDILREGSAQLNIVLSEHQVKQFDAYLKQLRYFNKKFNLTSITDPQEIVIKHFLDSLGVLSAGYIKDRFSLVDIGSGAGLPGLAIKIAYPSVSLTLLEANRKKSMFLDHMIDRLGLSNTGVVSLRAEEFGQTTGRNKFDIAISRALSSLPVSLEYAVPLLIESGYYLAMKARLENEPPVDEANKFLGARLVEKIKIKIPYLEAERNIVVFQKTGPTDTKYPRRAGVPAKNPLV